MADEDELKQLRDLGSKLSLKQSRETEEALKKHLDHAVELTRHVGDLFARKAATLKQNEESENENLKLAQRRNKDLQFGKHFYATSLFNASNGLLDEIEAEAKSCSELSSKFSTMAERLKTTANEKNLLLTKTLNILKEINKKVGRADTTVNKAKDTYAKEWDSFRKSKKAKTQPCYGAHNNYVIALKAYNELCTDVLETHYPELLDEMQTILNDLTSRVVQSIKQYNLLAAEQSKTSLSRMESFLDVIETVDGPSDISGFVVAQKAGPPIPPPIKTYVHPEPGYAHEKFENELKDVSITQDALKSEHEELMDEAIRLNSEVELTITSVDKSKPKIYEGFGKFLKSNPRSEEGELLDAKGKLMLYRMDQTVVKAKLELFKAVSYDAISTVESPVGNESSKKKMLRQRSNPPVQTGESASNVHLDIEVDSTSQDSSTTLKVEDQALITTNQSSHPLETSHNSDSTTSSPSDLKVPRSSNVLTTLKKPEVAKKPDWLNNIVKRALQDHQLLQSDELSKPTEPPPPYSETAVQLCVVLHSYTAENKHEHDLIPGEIIEVTSQTEGGWWQGKYEGAIKFFPANFVQPLQPGDKVMKVVQDYLACAGDEMNIAKDQVVVWKQDLSDKWVKAMAGNSFGKIPRSYVKEMPAAE